MMEYPLTESELVTQLSSEEDISVSKPARKEDIAETAKALSWEPPVGLRSFWMHSAGIECYGGGILNPYLYDSEGIVRWNSPRSPYIMRDREDWVIFAKISPGRMLCLPRRANVAASEFECWLSWGGCAPDYRFGDTFCDVILRWYFEISGINLVEDIEWEPTPGSR